MQFDFINDLLYESQVFPLLFHALASKLCCEENILGSHMKCVRKCVNIRPV